MKGCCCMQPSVTHAAGAGQSAEQETAPRYCEKIMIPTITSSTITTKLATMIES